MSLFLVSCARLLGRLAILWRDALIIHDVEFTFGKWRRDFVFDDLIRGGLQRPCRYFLFVRFGGYPCARKKRT